MKGLAVLGLALALAAVAPSASGGAGGHASDAEPAVLSATCAPPCGYIFPTIVVTTPVEGKLYLNESQTFPMTIRFQWSFDNDGTGLDDQTDPITLTFDGAKVPNWVEWSVEPAQIPLVPPKFKPLFEYEYTYYANLTLTPDDAVPLEQRAGNKMLLFVQSSESGMFKRSYGVEVFRFPTADDLAPEGDLQNDTMFASGVGALPLLAAGAAAAVLMALVRRRR